MIKMESSVDPRPKYLTEKVVAILKNVGMNSVGEGKTVHHNVHSGRAEIALNQMGNRTGHAGMCCWILRMVGSNAQWEPIHILAQRRVSTARRNRCHWPPKAVVVLAVKASDGGIGIPRPQNRHHPSAFR